MAMTDHSEILRALPPLSLPNGAVTGRSRFVLTHSRIMHETLAQETLIINLEAGIFYSLELSASVIWQRLIDGLMIEEIIHELQNYQGASAHVSQEVQLFISQLVSEGLLTVGDSPTCRENSKALPPSDAASHSTGEAGLTQKYYPPHLNRFNDLQNLLLADPIHELADAF